MEEGVEGVGGVGEVGADLFLEGVGEGVAAGDADEGVLQEEVELVAAVAGAEQDAERLEGLGGQQVAAGEFHRLLQQVGGDAAGALHVLRVAGVVRLVLAGDTGIGGAVDVVGVGVEGGEAAGEQGGGDAFGGGGEVGGGAEAAEALAEDGPGAPPVRPGRIASQSRTMESARKRVR